MQSSSGLIYTVRQGDSLLSISRRYNCSTAAINRENPWVDVYHLLPGDEICIPVDIQPQKQMISYIVKSDETILQIMTKFHIDFDELLKYNDLDTMKLQPGMKLRIPVQHYNIEEAYRN